MTLKEFAESRNVEYNALMQWLYRRPELRDQMPKEGKSYILDPESNVYDILDKQYVRGSVTFTVLPEKERIPQDPISSEDK